MIEVFTDGACKRDKKGGWGAVIYGGTHSCIIGGYEMETTSNRMELAAFIHALDHLSGQTKDTININSDSQYCVKGFTTWMHSWARCDWSGDIKNLDLWKELFRLKLTARPKPKATWVEGHGSSMMNRIADRIANYCIEDMKNICIHFKHRQDIEETYMTHIGRVRK